MEFDTLLYWLGEFCLDRYGDGLYRLLTSRVVLGAIGLGAAALLTWWLLPRLFRVLPHDRGRPDAHGSAAAVGKPTGAGLVFIPIFVAVGTLVVPFEWSHLAILNCALLALLTGYFDDRDDESWGEYKKAALDVLVAFCAAVAIFGFEEVSIWIPFVKGTIDLPAWLNLTGAAGLLWISINATNCTDGVDGLSGGLMVLAYTYLGGLLYAVVGRS
ncbi:MAG: phospho-N-acetylmuramoyl-pentapeptide-transferase, partial [Planctomycetota bacterium]